MKKEASLKKVVAKATSSFISSISDFITQMPSGGNIHEPKMPDSLKK